MGFALLILGLMVFVGIHVLTTRRALRASLIARFGEGGYKAAFSVIAVIGIVLVAKGFSVYRETEWLDVWYPPKALRHLTLALMLPAVILVVASFIRGRIYARLKHPMLAG